MRIIAGKNRGMLLKTPPGNRVRPTGDKVKGALFSILGTKIIGARVLDLFAGTGNLGIEAVSRGAESACFVDAHRESVAVIRENIEKAGQSACSRIMQSDCLVAIDSTGRAGVHFDIVFCDPPYAAGWPEKIAAAIVRNAALADGGVLIIEHPASEAPANATGLKVSQSRKYGNTTITFYEVNNADRSLPGEF